MKISKVRNPNGKNRKEEKVERNRSKSPSPSPSHPHPHPSHPHPHPHEFIKICFSFNIENSRRTSRCVNLNSHQFLLIPTNSKSNTNKFRSIPSQSFRLELISIGINAFLDLLLCLRFDGDSNQIVFQRK